MRAVKTFLIFLSVILLGVATLQAQADKPAGDSPAKTTPPQNTATNNEDEDRYLIGYEDVLEINVLKHPELRQKVSVGKNGTIFMPRIEEPIVAVCKTERQLADAIQEAYKKDYLRNPFVSVEVSEQKSQSASVIGAVEKPGTFYLTRKVTLSEMLALAGGPNINSGMRMVVQRSGSTSNCRLPEETAPQGEVQVMGFRISDIREGKKLVWMQPGDVVWVLEADPVYVYGNVREQGRLLMKEPTTLRQAIASARGLKSASDNKVRILRLKEGSADPEEFVYDLNAINKGKAEDPFLQAGDVVAVSEDKAKMILTKLVNSATGGIPALFYRVPL